MNQHIANAEISAFLDGALAASERARVDAHLSACPDCRREADSLRHLKRVLSSAPRRTMPADLALALERRLGRAEPRWSALVSRSLWIPAGAVAAAALAVGLWMSRSTKADELPLEPLLAAHARYSAETLVPAEHLIASSTYSDQLTALYADASDSDLE